MYSVTRSQIETLRRQGHTSGRVLAKMRQHIDESIAAILIVNTIANTLGAAWAGALVLEIYHDLALTIFSVAFTLCVLFFAEIVPKSLGVRFAASLAPWLAIPLQLLVWALWPVIKFCVLVTRIWGKGARISHGTEEDIISLARLVEKQGAIYPHEAVWVANALQLDSVTAHDLMTPNPVVARVPETLPLKHAKARAEHWRFSRLPVCSDANPDTIVGVVRRRRVFVALAHDEFEKTIGELMEPAAFVPDTMPGHELIDRFLTTRRHLFCVQDKKGQFLGVVTLEDVLECLLGREIMDETDLHEDMQELARRRKEALLRGEPLANVHIDRKPAP